MALLRWMAFVDGENLAIEGEKLKADLGSGDVRLVTTDVFNTNSAADRVPYFSQGEYVWFPPSKSYNLAYEVAGDRLPRRWASWPLNEQSERSLYYTSVVGSQPRLDDVADYLWHLRFDPVVLQKPKGHERAKGVDIRLATDLVAHAYLDNFDVAILISGDADFIPVIEEVKRRGKRVAVAAFGDSTDKKKRLRRAADQFRDLTREFSEAWRYSRNS